MIFRWPILPWVELLILRMNIMLILMTIQIIWLTNKLSLINIYIWDCHSRLLDNLSIVVHSRWNSVWRLSWNRHHLIWKHLISTLYHVELRWRRHIRVKMLRIVRVPSILKKLRTVCNWKRPNIWLVWNQMLRRDLVGLLGMGLANIWVWLLALGMLLWEIVIESVLYLVWLLTTDRWLILLLIYIKLITLWMAHL
jgi:hypothetical protein